MNKPHSKTSDAQTSTPGFDDQLEQLVDSPEFNEAIDHDFGTITDELEDGLSRRRWLQIMGASLALGGISGCRFEEEKIAPFAFRPQGRVPGIPEKFASMIEFGGVAQPLLSTNYDGRPIKLDGNPNHPSSLGASNAFTQATILEFYDPDRLRAPLKTDTAEKVLARAFQETSSDDVTNVLKGLASDLSGVAVLAEPTSSPSMLRLKSEFEAKGGTWYTFASVNDDNTRAGAKQAFGKVVKTHYNLTDAEVIVTLDSDLLLMDPNGIANSISFAGGRDVDHGTMSRMYCVESQYSTTGASADHRISVRSGDMAGFVASLAKAIDEGVTPDDSMPYRDKVLAAMASDLVASKGKGVIVVGESQPPIVHALAHALNEKLGNAGATVTYTDVPDPERLGSHESLAAMIDSAGSIKTLIVLGGNPVYGGPAALDLGAVIAKVPNSVHVTCFRNETSYSCNWVSNMAHPLESWKDGLAADGSVCVGQPLINPLFGGLSDLETIAMLTTGEKVKGLDIVMQTSGLAGNEWTSAVHDGFIADSAPAAVSVSAGVPPAIEANDNWKTPWDGNSLEFVFAPSRSTYDGRYANNSWLQELPDFITKSTWDNVLTVSPMTAEALGLKQNTKASVTIGDSEIRIPVNVQPGQADGSIGIALGYGRTAAGRVGGDLANKVPTVGQDVGPFRTAETWNFVTGLGKETITPSGTKYKLAIIQEPWTIDDTGRDEIQNRMFRDASKGESDRSSLIREGSFESFKEFSKNHHDHAKASNRKQNPEITPAKLSKSTALPIVTNVSFDPHAPVPGSKPVEDKESEDGHGAHHAQWPEAFHMHHELFDLTPGSRLDYTMDNPAHTNVWGMSIDLNKCTGCNSCVTACQAENNVPVVGRAEVWRGREMHWIRIDRYFGDNLYNNEAAESDDKQIVHQPVACHHCENAPCETVCPVAATVHNREGLNDMVYNRCIGTRYCGNNCPYKVRRFNYFNYSDAKTFLKYPGADKEVPGDRMLQNLMMNPEVTIRSRGVMEKCTYCVQRIQNTKIKARNEDNRAIGANEITVACQDACPTQAIKFGDLANKESDVAKAHANPRAYTMLEELNNRPRTKYLARVRNVHPALMDHDDRDSVPEIGGHGGDHGSHDDHDHDADHKSGEGDGHDHDDNDHGHDEKNHDA
jgi:molybdopterin-containing oxidoreductase family iron-sulfur binding subunit